MVAQAENTAQNAWETAKTILQSEMSRNTYDTYVRPTRLIDFNEGIFVIGCENDYNREWLANRLTSTVERLLPGVMNSPVKISFVIAEDEPYIVEEPDQADTDSDALEDSPMSDALNGSIRDKLIAPHRVVKFPIYILRWLQYVPAQIIFVVMALWQEHYLTSRGKSCRGNPEVSVRAEQVCKWAGVSRAQFFRLLEPGSGIYWFLKKRATDHEKDGRTGRMKKSSNQYTLFDLPMTPGDAEDLRAYLLDQGIAETPILALKTAIEADPMSILKYPVRLPSKDFDVTQPQYLTVPQIVQELVGHELDPDLLEMAETLADRLLASGEFLLVSWYFLRKWLPLLGPDTAIFILMLRSLCYFNDVTGEIRDEVWIEGGYEAIAQRLGIQAPRTVANWLPAQIQRAKRKEELSEQTDRELTRRQHLQVLINLFVERIDHRMNATGRYAWKFRIQRSDPLTPQDEAVLKGVASFFESAESNYILDEANAWIGQISKDWNETVKQEPKIGLRLSNLAKGCSETLKNVLNDCIETLDFAGNDWFETLLKTLQSIKDSIQDKDTSTNQDSASSPETSPSVEGVTDPSGNWSLEKLLAKANPKNRRLLVAQETNALAFVSWVIYGASQPSIQNPISLAISRLKANPGVSVGGASDRLSAFLPRHLANLIEQDLCLRSPTDSNWRFLFPQANRERVYLLVDSLGICLPT